MIEIARTDVTQEKIEAQETKEETEAVTNSHNPRKEEDITVVAAVETATEEEIITIMAATITKTAMVIIITTVTKMTKVRITKILHRNPNLFRKENLFRSLMLNL